MILRILPVLTIISACLPLQAQPEKDSFYKGVGLFSTRPSETKTIQNLKRFGPVGLSIDLCQPAFVMKVAAVEDGSPAAKTGMFEKGQIITPFSPPPVRPPALSTAFTPKANS